MTGLRAAGPRGSSAGGRSPQGRPLGLADVEARFGPEVALLMAEATDDKSLPKPERKRLQVERAAGKSPRAERIKLADKASNLAALAASPPAHWDAARRRAYVDWAREVAQGLRGVDPHLEAEFDRAVREAEAALASA